MSSSEQPNPNSIGSSQQNVNRIPTIIGPPSSSDSFIPPPPIPPTEFDLNPPLNAHHDNHNNFFHQPTQSDHSHRFGGVDVPNQFSAAANQPLQMSDPAGGFQYFPQTQHPPPPSTAGGYAAAMPFNKKLNAIDTPSLHTFHNGPGFEHSASGSIPQRDVFGRTHGTFHPSASAPSNLHVASYLSSDGGTARNDPGIRYGAAQPPTSLSSYYPQQNTQHQPPSPQQPAHPQHLNNQQINNNCLPPQAAPPLPFYPDQSQYHEQQPQQPRQSSQFRHIIGDRNNRNNNINQSSSHNNNDSKIGNQQPDHRLADRSSKDDSNTYRYYDNKNDTGRVGGVQQLYKSRKLYRPVPSSTATINNEPSSSRNAYDRDYRSTTNNVVKSENRSLGRSCHGGVYRDQRHLPRDDNNEQWTATSSSSSSGGRLRKTDFDNRSRRHADDRYRRDDSSSSSATKSDRNRSSGGLGRRPGDVQHRQEQRDQRKRSRRDRSKQPDENVDIISADDDDDGDTPETTKLKNSVITRDLEWEKSRDRMPIPRRPSSTSAFKVEKVEAEQDKEQEVARTTTIDQLICAEERGELISSDDDDEEETINNTSMSMGGGDSKAEPIDSSDKSMISGDDDGSDDDDDDRNNNDDDQGQSKMDISTDRNGQGVDRNVSKSKSKTKKTVSGSASGGRKEFKVKTAVRSPHKRLQRRPVKSNDFQDVGNSDESEDDEMKKVGIIESDDVWVTDIPLKNHYKKERGSVYGTAAQAGVVQEFRTKITDLLAEGRRQRGVIVRPTPPLPSEHCGCGKRHRDSDLEAAGSSSSSSSSEEADGEKEGKNGGGDESKKKKKKKKKKKTKKEKGDKEENDGSNDNDSSSSSSSADGSDDSDSDDNSDDSDGGDDSDSTNVSISSDENSTTAGNDNNEKTSPARLRNATTPISPGGSNKSSSDRHNQREYRQSYQQSYNDNNNRSPRSPRGNRRGNAGARGGGRGRGGRGRGSSRGRGSDSAAAMFNRARNFSGGSKTPKAYAKNVEARRKNPPEDGEEEKEENGDKKSKKFRKKNETVAMLKSKKGKQEINERFKEALEELARKQNHPSRLHKELWFNESGQMNEGPLCRCSWKSRQTGIRHDYFKGEEVRLIPTDFQSSHFENTERGFKLQKIKSCIGRSNNITRLYHYVISIEPMTNIQGIQSTRIPYDGDQYTFESFSLFSHQEIPEKLPPCRLLRWNIDYTITLLKQEAPENFTVEELELFYDYVVRDLMEMKDVSRRARSVEVESQNSRTEQGEEGEDTEEDNNGCPLFHLLPRFTRKLKDGTLQILPMSVVLQYLATKCRPLVSDALQDTLEHIAPREWDSFVESVKGQLVFNPTTVPTAIRLDQMDREGLVDDTGLEPGQRPVPRKAAANADQTDVDDPNNQSTGAREPPAIVHFGNRPSILTYAGNPEYQKVWKQYVKLRHLTNMKSKLTQEDRNRLADKEGQLQKLKSSDNQKRDVTVEVSSTGFYRTGLHPDVVHHTMMAISMTRHIRFHWGLAAFQRRIDYQFTRPALLELALTHPSYRTNYGTNPDHVRNTLSNCGVRQPEYGQQKHRNVMSRKRGINTLIDIMSRMGSRKVRQSQVQNNERLEYLGDAVIEFLSTIHLFYMFPDLEEGGLATYRSSLVQNKHLALLAKKLSLDAYMLYAHGPDLCQDADLRHATANAFEAVMGALFIDAGLKMTDVIFGRCLFPSEEAPELLEVWQDRRPHPLQHQEPSGDRAWTGYVPVLKEMERLEDRMGVQFHHIRLLAKAFTRRHTGYNFLTFGHNQRLEFLGDTVLQLITSQYLYNHFPEHHEGHLSLLRSCLVNNKTQSVICDDLGLTEFVVQNSVSKQQQQQSFNNNNGDDKQTATKTLPELRIKDKADLVESLIGALYVDQGIEACKVFCKVCFYPRLRYFIVSQRWNDPKSQLQQCCLTLRNPDGGEPDIPYYKVIKQEGPTNTREYGVAVYFRDRRLATGEGHSIQEAEMKAAEWALRNTSHLFPYLSRQKRVLSAAAASSSSSTSASAAGSTTPKQPVLNRQRYGGTGVRQGKTIRYDTPLDNRPSIRSRTSTTNSPSKSSLSTRRVSNRRE